MITYNIEYFLILVTSQRITKDEEHFKFQHQMTYIFEKLIIELQVFSNLE